MKTPMNKAASPLRRQAADVLLRARKLPPGPDRNDLRQLGRGFLLLYKHGPRPNQNAKAARLGFFRQYPWLRCLVFHPILVGIPAFRAMEEPQIVSGVGWLNAGQQHR
jgi:hypothetical protein